MEIVNKGGRELDLNEEPKRDVVLVVDDEEEIRTVLRLALTRAGYEIREAEDGRSALEHVQHDAPDLILLDVLMPEMDGFEVCRRVRAEPQTANIPILMFSAKVDPASKEEGLRAGATDYLTKPMATDRLLLHISTALRGTAE